MAKLTTISNAKKNAIKNKTAFSLPNRPSDTMSPDEIKGKYYKAIIDEDNQGNSLVEVADLIITETNNYIDDIEDGSVVVKQSEKAEKDASGNVITTTYETIADANQIKADVEDIEDGTTIVEKAKKDQNGNVINSTYSTKTELNAHTNASNPHNINKNLVGLGNVSNTGDSDVPVESGTTKFTTGGAYTELAKKQNVINNDNKISYNYITDKPTIPTTANEVHALPDTTKYGNSIELSLNTTTYILTATLKDQDGSVKGTASVDFPIESVVVSGRYDSSTKKVILTLQNGNTVDFSVADLVNGLQTEITNANKLPYSLISGTPTIPSKTSDLTNDSNFVTNANVQINESQVNNLVSDLANKQAKLPNASASGKYLKSTNNSGGVEFADLNVGTAYFSGDAVVCEIPSASVIDIGGVNGHILLGTNLSMSGNTLNATGGGGGGSTLYQHNIFMVTVVGTFTTMIINDSSTPMTFSSLDTFLTGKGNNMRYIACGNYYTGGADHHVLGIYKKYDDVTNSIRIYFSDGTNSYTNDFVNLGDVTKFADTVVEL